MHSWQNGTRCRDGVNVLWCCSHLVWLVFEGSIPTCTVFHSENFFRLLNDSAMVKMEVETTALANYMGCSVGVLAL